MDKKIDYTIFAPKSGTTLKRLYPELEENVKFRDISNEELTWVWNYACKASHLVKDENLGNSDRAKLAADLSFIAGTEVSKDAKKRFSKLELPERIKEAVDEMKKYDPVARALAAQIIETSFLNLYNMAAVNNDDFIEVEVNDKGDEIKRINFTARKQYTETVAKISEILPELIKQRESNFGVTKKTGDKSEKKLIDKYHDLKKE